MELEMETNSLQVNQASNKKMMKGLLKFCYSIKPLLLSIGSIWGSCPLKRV